MFGVPNCSEVLVCDLSGMCGNFFGIVAQMASHYQSDVIFLMVVDLNFLGFMMELSLGGKNYYLTA
jgi:hypothetical protein